MDKNERKEIEKIIRNNLRNVRVNKGYSQSKLAKELGISKSAISQIEKGNIKSIRFSKMIDICKKLDCSFYDIFIGTRIYVDEKVKQQFENNRNKLNLNSQIVNLEIDGFIRRVYAIYQNPYINSSLDSKSNYSKEYNSNKTKDLPKIIGDNIKKIRTRVGYTQEQLSNKMGIDIKKNKKICKIEKGNFKQLNISDLISICDALNISIVHLFMDYGIEGKVLALSVSNEYAMLDEPNRAIVDRFLQVIFKIQEENRI